MTCISWWHLPPFLFLCLPVLPVCLFYKTHRWSVIWLVWASEQQSRGEAWEAHWRGRPSPFQSQQSAGWRVQGSWSFHHSEGGLWDGGPSLIVQRCLLQLWTLCYRDAIRRGSVLSGVYLTWYSHGLERSTNWEAHSTTLEWLRRIKETWFIIDIWSACVVSLTLCCECF